MIVIMQQAASKATVDRAIERIEQLGLTPHVSRGQYRTIIGAIGDKQPGHLEALESLAGVERVVPIMRPYKLASREFHEASTEVKVGSATFGPAGVTIIAGPCAIESREMLERIAAIVRDGGAMMLRGGAFKPRTSPYAFQGLGEDGLKMLREVGDATALPVVSEVLAVAEVELVGKYVDMLQIGARNMQNFRLLKEVGDFGKPVLLKRGFAATIREYLMSAEYILSRGNRDVVLCERGIKTFASELRFTFDVSAVPVIKANCHLPIIVDPSHATGDRRFVIPLALAGIAAGADGVMVEVHDCPEEALCDGPQALLGDMFAETVRQVDAVAKAVGRSVAARDK